MNTKKVTTILITLIVIEFSIIGIFIKDYKNSLTTVSIKNMAAEEGFEPSQTESESAVLPLHHSAIFIQALYQTALFMSIIK